MKRILLFLLLTTLSLFAEEKSWSGVEYTEVRAYAWHAKREGTKVIQEDMSPKARAINPEGALLSPDQVKRLLAAAGGNHPRYNPKRCHIPHNAFVFYDAKKKPVAYLELCFSCLNHRPKSETTAQHLDWVSLATIFDEHKLPLGNSLNLEAFKKSFQNSIKEAEQ